MLEDYIVDNYPMSSIETLENIINIMKSSICKISINNGQQGTGFFCNINLNDWEILRVLITTDFFIDGNDFVPGHKINISLNEGKIKKEIIIEENRKKYTNQEFGITFIEIKSKDGIKKESFLDIDENIYDKSPKEYLKRLPIFLLQYPNGDKIKKSEGLIINLKENNYTIEHLCKCDICSSGGPLINFNNNKVIGIHKDFGDGPEWNLGIFIKAPIEKFKETLEHIENNQNLQEENNININNLMNNMNINMNNNFMDFNNNMNNMNMINNMNNMNNNFMNFNNNMNNNMNRINFMNINNNMNNFMNNNMNNFMNNNMNMNNFMNNNMNLNNNINNMNRNNDMNDIIYEGPEPDFLVKLEASSGISIKIKISKNTSIKKLIKIYCKKIGITENYCINDIIFLYNGSKLDFNLKNKLKSLTNDSQIVITVIDQKGLLSKIEDIVFMTPSGIKTNIKSSKSITVDELIKLYANYIGLEEKFIGKEIYFIFNGSKLNPKSKKTLNNLLIDKHQNYIYVIDPNNIIDSIKNICFNSSSGLRTLIKADPNSTIENLLKKYKEEIEIDENNNEEQIIFLFNGTKLNGNSKEKIGNILKQRNPRITVVDNYNIINK